MTGKLGDDKLDRQTDRQTYRQIQTDRKTFFHRLILGTVGLELTHNFF